MRRGPLALLAVALLSVSCQRAKPATVSTPEPAASPVLPAPTDTPTLVPTATPTPEAVEYVVQEGDNIFSIALRFGVTPEAIAANNDLADPNQLEVGQVLIIPLVGEQPTPEATATAEATPAPETIHLVLAGESLTSISLRYGVSVEAIAQRNGLAPPYTIFAGQELVIPSDGEAPSPGPRTYVVQAGDTLSGIAFAFGTTVEAIAAANGLAPPYTIFAGQELVIP